MSAGEEDNSNAPHPSNGDEAPLLKGAQAVLDHFLVDLHEFHPTVRRFVPDLDAKLVKVLNRYPQGFRIGSVRANGAFLADQRHGLITLDKGAIIALAKTLKKLFPGANDLDTEAMLFRAVEVYAVHEALHIEQGLSRFADVQKVKLVGPRDLLGQFDLLADHDAARFVAALAVARMGRARRVSFLHELLLTESMVNAIAPQTFKAPPDKPHKRHRFLGIALHVALLNHLLIRNSWEQFEKRNFSLDTPLYPYVSLDDGQVILTGMGVSPKLIGSAHAPTDFLRTVLDGLDSEPFHHSVQRAEVILYLAGILPAVETAADEVA